MNIFKLSVGFLLVTAIGSHSLSAQTKLLSIPVEVQFLNRGDKPIEGQFTIRSGQVFVSDGAGNETPSALGRLDGSKGAAFTGPTETILGAPAVVFARQEIETPSDLSKEKHTIRAAAQSGATIFVRSTRTNSTEPSPSYERQVITGFIVSQQTSGSLAELGRFSFHENTFNQYLSEIWPISDEILAIVTRSSRHPKLNTLFMFDLKKHQLVGMREFSVLQYLPAVSSVWIAQSVVNCDNIDEVFAEAKRKAQVFPLFANGEISPDFQSLDGIDGNVARKAESGSTDKHPSASLPMVRPQSPTKSPETTTVPSSEEATSSTSSTSWFVWAVLTVAATGLLWLLLKRRS